MDNEKGILLSSAYLPPVSWFSLLLKHAVWIEKHETYLRQSYRNRCAIYSERGMLSLSVPVTKPGGNHTLITKAGIFNDEKWYLKHWRAIRSAYEASPYFLYYKDELHHFYSGSFNNLFDLNQQLLQKMCELLDIRPQISYTKVFKKKPAETLDLRNYFSPKKQVTGIFPKYTQVFSDRHGFLPDLSILDLLFNLGPESKHYLDKVRVHFP